MVTDGEKAKGADRIRTDEWRFCKPPVLKEKPVIYRAGEKFARYLPGGLKKERDLKTIDKSDAILAWHFLPEDRRYQFEPRTLVECGKTYVHDGPVKLCKSGLHASIRAIDALGHAPGSIITRVRCWGRVDESADKLSCDHRQVIAMGDATMPLHAFACTIAENALDAIEAGGGKVDERSREAIRVRRLWIDGNASNDDLSAAESEAWSAAWSAANEILEEMLGQLLATSEGSSDVGATGGE